ncbi:SIMPL domain-containing protein [Erysipelothrix sp. HDW6C]|uniref:SIMPL domain-containing protein n=1 Tax=Erysipelothrix sp. HDW6C TaxID=2714930 RepID=UPI001408BACE|nr:SIMPL domain-containing protein [Erysipelothrix sp. HDW6C]QIK69640.1 SIMPL domain-containing protein [Erysipelothrix sp. HDW6C]
MTRILRIEGRGQVKAKPDMMRFHYELVQDAPSYGESYDNLTAQYKQIVAAFKKVEFNTVLIQTSSIDVSIMHETKETPKVFRSSQRLIFEDKINFDKMSKLLDVLRSNDDFNFSLSYFVKDSSRYDNDALILAINDANDRAKLIAETAGIKLNGIQSIEYGSMGGGGPVMYRSMADTAVGMNASDIIISKDISITWDIK